METISSLGEVMKIIGIGDIHGHDSWKRILSEEKEFDKVVFIGDYFDSFSVPTFQQIENFKDIIALKKADPDKVILLLGNHDYHYLRGISEAYSGYQELGMFDIQEVLQPAVDDKLIQIAFQHKLYLFTHAGVSKRWASRYGIDTHSLHIDDQINKLFFDGHLDAFSFHKNKDYGDPYGDEVTQSPLWIRPVSLMKDAIEVGQIVGHTTHASLEVKKNVAFIDTLGTSGEYLLLRNKGFYIKKINIKEYE